MVAPKPVELLSLWGFVLCCGGVFFLLDAFYVPGEGTLSNILSILWSLPVFDAIVALWGNLQTKQEISRLRKLRHTPPLHLGHLLIVVPTIGRYDTLPSLKRAVRSFCEHLPPLFPSLGIDIVIEERSEARSEIVAFAAMLPDTRVIVVPHAYHTVKGTRFKARALHYAQQMRGEGNHDNASSWILHMDDDTSVGPDTAESIAQFIHEQQESPNPKLLAQGILTFPFEYSLGVIPWVADAVRPPDDAGHFGVVNRSGYPTNGMHGELMLINAAVEAELGWDLGPHSIGEDSVMALKFCTRFPGRSGWFLGRSYGASPASIRDFIRQRRRWSAGLFELTREPAIHWYYRVWISRRPFMSCLTTAIHILVLLRFALVGPVNIFPSSRLILMFWSVTVLSKPWAYLQGLRLNMDASAHPLKITWFEYLQFAASTPLAMVLEMFSAYLGILDGFRGRPESFDVIPKLR